MKVPKMTIPSSKVDITLAAGSTEPAMKAADAKSGKVFNVPVGKIMPIPGFNVRVDSPDYRAHIAMIADSIRANGYDPTKPLAGFVHKVDDERGNVIYVTDGHTRLAALGTLGEDAPATVPVIVRAPAPNLTDLTVALHTNNTGRPLTPFELGVVVKRLLKEEGADKAAIAARLAVTPRYLDDVLLLVNSPKEVRTAVLEGNVSSTFAIQTLRKSPEKAAETITAAVTKAKAAGKTKATAKDAAPKMKTVKTNVAIENGADMKEIVKAVAAAVRAAVPATSPEDADAPKTAMVEGAIVISITVPAPVKPAKKTKAPKAAPSPVVDQTKTTKPKKGAAKTEATSEPKPAAKKKGGKKPAAETPPVADDDNISADDDDIGIEGAEPAEIDRTDVDLDLPTPPSTKGNAPADEESDI